MDSQIEILAARWIAPVLPRNTVYEQHAVVVSNGQIIDLLPTTKANEKYPAATLTDLSDHLLIPGLINAHTHAAMSLFRGLADDLPLMDWLQNHMWPAEAKWISPDFVRDGTELAIAEMLLSGTTCFNDMYFFSDEVARTAQYLGIRAFVGLIVIDFPSAWAANSDEYFSKGLKVHDEIRSLSRIDSTIAPHAPYTVGDAPLERVRTYADELHIPIQMHVHETSLEVEEAIDTTGKRPLSRLHDLGLLNPRMMAVHMTQLNDDEIELCGKQGVSVVHCPESNMKLASGQCRVADLLSSGTNVCLGTDGAASNNDLDMLGEMRSAALLAKITSNDATALPAWQCLEMATINGAKALNVDDRCGSIEVGKVADLVAIDLGELTTQPVYKPIAHLVYSASRSNISHVWVDGKLRVKHGELTGRNHQAILEKARHWGEKINNHD